MAKVRSKGNASTEGAVEAMLKDAGLTGWVKQPKGMEGTPDFYFPKHHLLLFVDGCFWHACPKCGRIPKSRVAFWQRKIEDNRRRDRTVTRRLQAEGYHVVRVWEHEVRNQRWLRRLQSRLGK